MPDCAASYGIQGCTVTTDHEAYSQANAVIIHHREIMDNLNRLPLSPRPQRQKWIWMNLESPTHTSGLEELEGIFNWTMSYKVGSDIFMPYGYLRPRNATRSSSRVLLPHKKRLVAWVISNWNEDHARVILYWKLRTYIPIDVYGRNDKELVNKSVVQTVSQYKFYLAFENSQHPDYITEKLWRNALGSSAVPVVLGPPRSNYERFLPADAFIHVDDFRSPKMLAAYLRFLAKPPSYTDVTSTGNGTTQSMSPPSGMNMSALPVKRCGLAGTRLKWCLISAYGSTPKFVGVTICIVYCRYMKKQKLYLL